MIIILLNCIKHIQVKEGDTIGISVVGDEIRIRKVRMVAVPDSVGEKEFLEVINEVMERYGEAIKDLKDR